MTASKLLDWREWPVWVTVFFVSFRFFSFRHAWRRRCSSCLSLLSSPLYISLSLFLVLVRTRRVERSSFTCRCGQRAATDLGGEVAKDNGTERRCCRSSSSEEKRREKNELAPSPLCFSIRRMLLLKSLCPLFPLAWRSPSFARVRRERDDHYL